MKPEDLANLATTAFNSRDRAGLRALWADDLELIGPDGERHGADLMLQQEEALWRAFPDIKASIETVCIGQDVLAQETTMVGTHNGPLAIGGTELPPTGRSITLIFAVHLWFRNGLVQRERVFYDRLALLRQLGLR